ncbi:hypothetical protein SCHIN_v1c02850 [Spiroplasma chinense]|uniref:Uncharacterized protein n=1 Tax=Spiroplasma chinense TaxID=216932 RepID=A0A5B9Y612_9MOLU|nr:hypothetical protein [Spiroplasma chinense]QEH61482.1 hypothetical protein SCHIN_v1c02850 [Spiroplasma chinense]
MRKLKLLELFLQIDDNNKISIILEEILPYYCDKIIEIYKESDKVMSKKENAGLNKVVTGISSYVNGYKKKNKTCTERIKEEVAKYKVIVEELENKLATTKQELDETRIELVETKKELADTKQLLASTTKTFENIVKDLRIEINTLKERVYQNDNQTF